MTTRRVSYEQLEIMWEFLTTHRDVAVGFNKSAQARATCRRIWTELSQYLNSIVGGAIKDWKSWSNYWVDYKGKLKRKCASIRASHLRTGGGPSTVPELTEIELKFLSILGEDLGSGLPGIQVSVETELTHETSNELETLPTMDIALFASMATTDPDVNSGPSTFTLQDQPPSIQLDTEPAQPDTQPAQPDTQPAQPDTQPAQPGNQPTQPGNQPTLPDTQPALPDTQPAQPDNQPARPTEPRTGSAQMRQRRRPTPMSQEAARRSLAESSRMRAEATVNMAHSLDIYLRRIADTLDRIHQSLSGLPTNEQ